MPAALFRIQHLEIEGFKAFAAPQTFDIGGHMFVFGRNGFGKSSIVEAVRWCLFGLADRPEAEVRNVFYSTGDCKVELKLLGPGGIWKVQRRLRPGSSRSDLTIRDPGGANVSQSKVFPHIARLGPREGTHIIFASQQSSHHRRPQADITDFDKVLYSYLQIDDVPDLLQRLDREIEEQAEIEQQLAKDVDEAEEELRSKLNDLRNRIEEILKTTPWAGENIPTNAETDTRIRSFVSECGGNLERADGGPVTSKWLLTEAERAINELSAATQETVQQQLTKAKEALQKRTTAKQKFDVLSEQLAAAQGTVDSCEHDLNKSLGATTKQKLLTERDELSFQDNQLAKYLALAQQAAFYFEEFSPMECPACDTGIEPADILSRLQNQILSSHDGSEVTEALKRIQEHLETIEAAEKDLEAAKKACSTIESDTNTARAELVKLLDDPTDLSSCERTVMRLSDSVRQFEAELNDRGSLVMLKQNTLKNLKAEVRFQEYRLREERLHHDLETGLQPARDAHRGFAEELDTLRAVYEALQESFNETLNRTLPRISELMTEVYGRLTQQSSFPEIVVESGQAKTARTLRVRVTSDRTPGESFDLAEVLNGQAFNALNLVPYFVFSQFQAEALELDCLLIDDPSQSFDTSRVELLMQELASAATHAQLIVASHEEERFLRFIDKYFSPDSYHLLRVTAFAPEVGPTLVSGY